MFNENISIGLDIATALSIIAASIAFLWNAITSNKRERKERQIANERKLNEVRKNTIRQQVMIVIENLYYEKRNLNDEVQRIGEGIGEINSLQPYYDIIQNFTEVVEERFMPFARVYGDERFLTLFDEYQKEIEKFIFRLQELTGGESNEKWDFYEVMFEPKIITDKFIQELLVQSEAYIQSLN